MYVVHLLCYKNKTCKSSSRWSSSLLLRVSFKYSCFCCWFFFSGLAILDSLLFFNHRRSTMSRPRNFVMLFTQPIVINISVEHVFFTAHYHSWYPGKRGVVVAPFFTFCQLFVYFRCSRAFGFGMTCCLTPSKEEII